MIEEVNKIVSTNENITDQARMVVQTLVEKKSVALFPLPKFIDDEVIERIKRKISLTRTCVLSEDASVSLSEGAKLQIDSLVKNVEGNMSLHIKDISKFIEKYNKKYGYETT